MVVAEPAPAPSVKHAAPDLGAVGSPADLEFGALVRGLEGYLAQGDRFQRLGQLYERWGLKARGEYVLLAEADLDGDGRTEAVTALNGAGGLTGLGSLLVISEQDGRVLIDRPAGEPVPRAALFGVADLTGDKQPELIWSHTELGAHTATTSVHVSRWEPGRVESLPGQMLSTNMRLELEGKDLLLIGGTIGSAGAGGVQRERTDRYRWTGDSFRLADMQFAPSPLGYHRLIDGIAAETHGRKADAESAYRDVIEESRPTTAPGLVPPEQEAPFGQAVRAMGRFRLAAFLLADGRGQEARAVAAGAAGPFAGLLEPLARGEEPAAVCRAAEAWAQEHPAFLEGLASPFGYAKPVWQPADLCGPLPPLVS